jgi:hypothetical protein
VLAVAGLLAVAAIVSKNFPESGAGTDGTNVYGYRCYSGCRVTLLFPAGMQCEDVKAFCCGRTITLPELGWLEQFPREQAPRYRPSLMALQHPRIDVGFED